MTWAFGIEILMLLVAFGLGGWGVRSHRRAGWSWSRCLGLGWDRQAARDLLMGLLITGSAMAGVYGIEVWTGMVQSLPAPGGRELLPRALWMALAVLKEEVVMRSLLLGGLVLVLQGRRWHRSQAVLISAVAFGCIHLSNPSASPLSVLGNTLGGVIYGVAFVATGRIWMSLGLHFAWNFVQGPVFGFPVSGLVAGGLFSIQPVGAAWLSGGAYGPEAGAVGMASRGWILLMLWLSLARRPANGLVQSSAQALR